MKVLLFTAHFGDGHRQVATALKHEFQERGIEVAEIDCMRNAHPKYARFNEASFELTTKYTPYLYGWSYTWTRYFPNNSWLWKFMSAGARETATAAVKEFAPDAVLQLFPEHILDKFLKSLDQDQAETRNEAVRPPVAGVVVTDFSTHSRWYCPNMDVYYLPHPYFEEPARKIIKSTTHPEFVASGIPLRPQFTEDPRVVDDAEFEEAEFEAEGVEVESGETRLSPRRSGHILVATGGRGVFGGLKKVLVTLYDRRDGRDVVVMCGRNTAMLRLVQELAATRPGLVALPFVEEVAPWLKSAAYAVVKPGGVTVSECLASACPMLFYRPPLGQELDNARWVTHRGAGQIAKNLSELEAAADWFSDRANTEMSSEAAESLGRADAAKRVVEDVIQRVRAKSTEIES